MLNTEKTHDLADDLFFLVMEHVNREEFIEPDPDSDGTRNTEKGRDLYYAIEDLLLKICQLNTLQWLSLVWLLLSHSLDFQRQQTNRTLKTDQEPPTEMSGVFYFPIRSTPVYSFLARLLDRKDKQAVFSPLPIRESGSSSQGKLSLDRKDKQAQVLPGPIVFSPPEKTSKLLPGSTGPDPFQIEKTSKQARCASSLSFRRLERQARSWAAGSWVPAPFLRKDKQANTTGVRNTAMGPEDGSSLRKDKQAVI